MRHDPFVAVTSGHFVALGDFTLLGDVHANQLVYAWRQLVAVLAGKHFDVDDNAVAAMRYAQ